MKRRRRLIAGLLLAAAAAVAGGAWLAAHWTSPSVVRRQVIAALRQRFPGAEVHLGSASLRLLGGVSLTDLSLSRRDDPDRVPFLTVPSAVLFHDKELLAEGRFALRKVELQSPRIRLTRETTGQWNVDGVADPGSPDELAPTLVLDDAVVRIEDHTGQLPTVEMSALSGTAVNDPLGVFCFRGEAVAGPLGPARAAGTLHLADGTLEASFDVPTLDVTAEIMALAYRIAPDTFSEIRTARGKAAVSGKATVRGGAIAAHDVTVRLAAGRYEHPLLPMPLERLSLTARSVDGRCSLDDVTAVMGGAGIRARIRTMLPDAPSRAVPGVLVSRSKPAKEPGWKLVDFERTLAAFDVDVTGLHVNKEFIAKLPPFLQGIQDLFAPNGPVDLTYRFKQDRVGGAWDRTLTTTLQGIDARFARFPYPITDVRGTLAYRGESAGDEATAVDLTAKATGRPVVVRGELIGDQNAPSVRMDLTADGVPIDDTLTGCLAPRFRHLIRSFSPVGVADVKAEIRYNAGEPLGDNHYVVGVRADSITYEPFPYPLEQVRGVLDIRTGQTDSWEFRDFVGTRHGGKIAVRGRNVVGKSGPALEIGVSGTAVPLDDDLGCALARLGLQQTWESFSPRGRVDFAAEIRHSERPVPVPPADGSATPVPEPPDLDLRVTMAGGGIKPDFLPYELVDLRGSMHYRDSQLQLTDFSARHGPVRLGMARCHVVPPPAEPDRVGLGMARCHVVPRPGGAWADLRDVVIAPLVADADLLAALPRPIAEGVAALTPSGRIELHARQLVVDRKPDPPAPAAIVQRPIGPVIRAAASAEGPVVYWDGELRMDGASFSAGVNCAGAVGKLASRGSVRGSRLERIVGNLLLDRVLVVDQPLTQVHARFEDDPNAGDTIMLYPHGKLFGGTIGGSARVTMSPLAYSMKLTATELDLERLARHNRLKEGAQLQGKATAQVFLAGRGGASKPGEPALEGGGTVDIPDARIYNLPMLLDLLKMVNLHAPDRTAFEEAHARFRIIDRRVYVDRLDLLGNAISLGGTGELNIDGTDAGLEFYAVWSRLVQLMPPLVRELPAALSKGLYRIKLTGSFGENGTVDMKQHPVPMLIDPLKAFLERVKARKDEGGRMKDER